MKDLFIHHPLDEYMDLQEKILSEERRKAEEKSSRLAYEAQQTLVPIRQNLERWGSGNRDNPALFSSSDNPCCVCLEDFAESTLVGCHNACTHLLDKACWEKLKESYSADSIPCPQCRAAVDYKKISFKAYNHAH